MKQQCFLQYFVEFLIFILLRRFIILMIYISEREQEKIKIKIKKLPDFFKRPFISIGLFQFLGTFILAYGTCMSRYTHPISERHININYQFLTCCFFYFALSVAAPFSGGHLNPSITFSMHFFKKINNKRTYIIGQFLGTILGTVIGKKQIIQLIYFSELFHFTTGKELMLDLYSQTLLQKCSEHFVSFFSGY